MRKPATNVFARHNAGRPGPLEWTRKEILMLRTRLFGLVALLLVVALAGCRHAGGCPSCSRSAAPSNPGGAGVIAESSANIPAAVAPASRKVGC